MIDSLDSRSLLQLPEVRLNMSNKSARRRTIVFTSTRNTLDERTPKNGRCKAASSSLQASRRKSYACTGNASETLQAR